MKINPPQWLKWDEDTVRSYDEKKGYYRYTYGIKDIQIKHKEFEDASVYVSKPFNIDGNIAEISLKTEEYNHKDSTKKRGINPNETDLEYYVSFNEHPTVKDWIPILPQGKEYIENELLIFRDKKICSLRFQCGTDKEKTVYKNGVKLDSQFWSYGADNTITIDKGFDQYSTYTISYYPSLDVSSPWDIELKEKDRDIVSFYSEEGMDGEVFNRGTNRNGELVLSKHPYIDYERINNGDVDYQPIRVILESKDDVHKLAGPNSQAIEIVRPYPTEHTSVITKNVTDYKGLNTPILKPYNTSIDTATNQPINPQFEYYQEGRKLFFTETFNNTRIISNQQTNHGDAIINVSYEYLRASVRLKIIARNTFNGDSAVTPVLKNYSLIFKVVK